MILKTLPIFLILTLSTVLVGQEIDLDPNKGWRGRALEVTVSGTNTTFQSATSTCNPLTENNISFKQATSTVFNPVAVDISSDELMELDLQIPASVNNGLYDVVLWDGEPGCEYICPGCFDVLDPPLITSVDPNTTDAGVSISTLVSGDNFCFDIDLPNCDISENNVQLVSVVDGSIINPVSTSIVGSGLAMTLDLDGTETTGLYNIDIALGMPCGVTCSSCFEILVPDGVLTVMGTDIGIQGTDVTITAEIGNVDVANCNYGSGDVVLELDGYTIPVTNLMIAGNQMTFDVSIPDDAPLGNYNIVVADGQGMPCNVVCDECFIIDEDSSIDEELFEDGLFLYPNPTDSKFVILSAQARKMVDVEIYNTQGQMLYRNSYQRFMKEEIDLGLSSGAYIVKIIQDENSTVRKLIVN